MLLPFSMFFQLFNDLALPLRHSIVNYVTEERLAALTLQHHFGGAVVHSPIENATFLISIRSNDRAIDTLYLRSEGSVNVIVGDNTSWRGIHSTFTSDSTPLAYGSKPILVLANSPDDPAATICSTST
jgi:hypothetical protein